MQSLPDTVISLPSFLQSVNPIFLSAPKSQIQTFIRLVSLFARLLSSFGYYFPLLPRMSYPFNMMIHFPEPSSFAPAKLNVKQQDLEPPFSPIDLKCPQRVPSFFSNSPFSSSLRILFMTFQPPSAT